MIQGIIFVVMISGEVTPVPGPLFDTVEECQAAAEYFMPIILVESGGVSAYFTCEPPKESI
jgi:hypothetical protein